MRTPILFAMAGLVTFGFVGCALDTRQVSATNPTVTYAVPERDELGEADRKASNYCQDFGRQARLHTVSEDDDGIQATYECV
jgi:hypothetical protein